MNWKWLLIGAAVGIAIIAVLVRVSVPVVSGLAAKVAGKAA